MPDPRLSSTDGKTAISIRRILQGFKTTNGNEVRQKAIPVSVICQVHMLYSLSTDPMSIATSQLIIGSFFFAVRSCKYSKTTSPAETKRTKTLTISDIRFFKNSELVPHESTNLQNADIIPITFRSQKNGEKNQTISMHKSQDPALCPVKVWASIVQRIRSYKLTSDSSTVNFYLNKQRNTAQVTSNQIRTKIRAAAASIGEKSLGFKIEEIGCHSL
jgi:hypothetical protein